MQNIIIGLIVGILFGIIIEDAFDIIHFKDKFRKNNSNEEN